MDKVRSTGCTSGRGGIGPFIAMCVISVAFGLADEYVQGGMVGDWSFMRHEFSFLAGLAALGDITSGLRMITKGVLDIHKMVYETEQVAKLWHLTRISVGRVTTVSVWVMLLKLSNAARAGPVQTLHMNLRLTTQYPSPKELPVKAKHSVGGPTNQPNPNIKERRLTSWDHSLSSKSQCKRQDDYCNSGVFCEDMLKGAQSRSKTKTFEDSKNTPIRRVAHEWFTKEFMGSITTWDSMVEKFILKFHHLSDHNDDEEEEDSSETDNAPEFFMIEGNLFDFETPLCKAYNKINYLLKFDTDLFTYDIQSLKELPEMVRVGTMTYFQDHSWYDELADGKLKDETLTLKTKIERLCEYPQDCSIYSRDPLEFIPWRNLKFKDHKKVDETTKHALLHTWIEIGNEEGLLNNEVSSDEEWEEQEYGNPPKDSFPKPYFETDKYNHNENNRNTYKSSGMDLSGAPQYENINNGQPNEGVCRVDKFEVIKSTIGDNEEFLAICTCECDSWERTVNGVSSIYNDIFRKKDEGWTVHRTN
ncbi:reverse transcriptase domain-containing protein [Tanacetum coccineum]